MPLPLVVVVREPSGEPPGGVGEPAGQGAGSAANFKDEVFLSQLGGANDKIEQVEIDQEILAEFVLRLDPAIREQVAEVGKSLTR